MSASPFFFASGNPPYKVDSALPTMVGTGKPPQEMNQEIPLHLILHTWNPVLGRLVSYRALPDQCSEKKSAASRKNQTEC